jgi:ribonuclease P protein component
MILSNKKLSRRECDELFLRGKKIVGNYVKITYEMNDISSQNTVIISKKILKKAHDRNRCKRRIRSLLNYIVKTYNVTGIYIVSIQKDIRSVPYELLQDDVLTLMKKVGVISTQFDNSIQ